MRKEDLQSWLADPASVDVRATHALEQALQDFPYSSILHQLYLKGLQNQESYLATAQLKKTSILSSNRSVLLEWTEGFDDQSTLMVPELAKSKHKPIQPSEIKPSIESFDELKPKKEPTKVKPVVSKEEVSIHEEERKRVDKPLQTKPNPHEAKPTVLGDDLSHLPERVRAIVEKSRKLQSDFGHSKEKEPEIEQPESKPEIEEVSELQEEVVVFTDSVSITEESVEAVQEETPPHINFDALDSIAESLNGDIVSEEVEASEEVEEREFSIPIALEELTEELEEEKPSKEDKEVEALLSSSVELDFISWLKQKNHSEEEEQPSREKVLVFTMNEPEKKVSNSVSETKKAPVQERKKSKMDLIDKFIQDQPKIKPIKSTDVAKSSHFSRPSIDVSAMGSEVGDDFITETLAQVYKQQGYYDKALSAYEILRLKYPEKSSFFASQISELRKLMKKS